jgi:hypothetical protein
MGFDRTFPARAGRSFLDPVKGQRGECPIAGEIEQSLSGIVRVSFVCPLGALASKFSIFAGREHSGYSDPDDPIIPLQTDLSVPN